MLKFSVLGCGLLAASLATSALADVFPESGSWFPVTGGFGSGLMLDRQSDLLVVGLYTYDDQGQSVWGIASGKLADGVLEADLQQYRDGFCIACEDGPVMPSGDPKQIRLSFSAATRGVLEIDGESVQIQNYTWLGYGAGRLVQPEAETYLNVRPSLQGTWTFAGTDPDSAFARQYTFDGNSSFSPPFGPRAEFSDCDDADGAIICCSNTTEAAPDAAYCTLFALEGNQQEAVLTVIEYDIGAERLVGYAGEAVFDEQGQVMRGDTPIYGFRIPARTEASPE